MRSPVLRLRKSLAGQSAILAVMLATATGCSSDFTRFDSSLYSGSGQQASTQVASNQVNPYPGDVDGTTTASINNSRFGAPRPADEVEPRPIVADHAGYDTNARNTAPDYQKPQYGPAARGANNNYSGTDPVNTAAIQRPAQHSSVQRSALPAPTVANNQPAYQRPLDANIDPVTTSSARPAANSQYAARHQGETSDSYSAPAPRANHTAQDQSPRKGGWTAVGGTVITLKEGESVYNLSKRYGVPANELLHANRISDPAAMRAGQTIIVPQYVYSRDAGVSAPDNNRQTRYARATTGSIVQPAAGRVPVPSQRPYRVAYGSQARTNEKPDYVIMPQPDRSITTGSVRQEQRSAPAGDYTVQSGDTLTRIASRNGTTVSAIMQANGMTDTTVRLGQTLRMPGGPLFNNANERIAAAQLPPNVDPIVTGTPTKPAADPAKGPKPYVKPGTNASTGDASTPERTGIGSFRWPVRGRIIATYGSKVNGERNDGIDISVPEGTAVKAAENGVVVYAGSELEDFGNLLLVRHGDGWVSAYAHNKELEVSRGDVVKRGQIIARSGRTGKAEMPKLHFELRRNSTPVDPIGHLGS